jgi:hypothetical protein
MQKNDIAAVAFNNDMIDRNSARIQSLKHEKPLKTKDYFIQFSRLFKEKYPALPETIWLESSRYLKSGEGQTAMRKYETLENFP